MSTIATIADTVLGYGSPQIGHITSAVCELTGGQAVIFQPLMAQRRVVPVAYPGCTVETIHTACHPYSMAGRREYLEQCARYINVHKPDILILSHYILFDLLDCISYRPKKIIHIVLEDLEQVTTYHFGRGRLAKIRAQAKKIDLWVFPEVNRARYDAHLLNLPPERICIFYNTAIAQHIPPLRKNGRIVYAGTLDVECSVSRYIFDKEMVDISIDVFGDLQGTPASKSEMAEKIRDIRLLGTRSHLRWFDQIPRQRLDELLPEYCFSLVFWLPVRHALLNASPNKFFQAISAGVPVISAPHPQTKMLIERYGCGLLLDGWEKHQLIAGLERAAQLIGTRAYAELQGNCRTAAAAELSWDVQFDKFAKIFRMIEAYKP